MKLLYLGGLCSEEYFDKAVAEGFGISPAAHKLEKRLISNLLNMIGNQDVTVISSIPCDRMEDLPKGENLLGVFVKYIWDLRCGIKGLVKSILSARREIKAWEKSTCGQKRVVLVYATKIDLLVPMFMCRFFHRDIKVITICSEIPKFRSYEYMGKTKGRLLKWAYTFLNESMDGYVFLSKYMNEECNKKNRPWIVVEGIPDVSPTKIEDEYSTENSVVYAGGLESAYGIEELLDAADYVKSDVKFLIAGSGMLEHEVQEKAGDKIKFLGKLPNREILEIEKKAAILINPRKPDLMLTRYSFPSKTLEYMSNGRAVSLITRLDGIPQEYFEHCFVIDEVTPEGIAQKIDEIMAIPLNERVEKAKKAHEFVVKNKSARAQTEKILDFMKSFCNN